ncbi:MAG: PadR family transcriptional regulator [Candidatus Aenigmarchaeota archaeon]|nr:PadR family transcriptional regulator [Candidatus Aenigmarchaeota archaeon]
MVKPSQRLLDSVTKNNLWFYILSLLSKKDMYPYEIRDKIKKIFGFEPGNVTAYFVLYRLEKSGYVKSGKTLKKGGPERKYYKITEKGKNELKKGKEILRKTIEKRMI